MSGAREELSFSTTTPIALKALRAWAEMQFYSAPQQARNLCNSNDMIFEI
jgi:hypothetical protein